MKSCLPHGLVVTQLTSKEDYWRPLQIGCTFAAIHVSTDVTLPICFMAKKPWASADPGLQISPVLGIGSRRDLIEHLDAHLQGLFISY